MAVRVITKGTAGDDVLIGTDANDEMHGCEGNDTLRGGVTTDLLFGGLGDDIYDGGPDSDYAIFYNTPNGVRVDLSLSGSQDTGEGRDTFISIENIFGSDYGDVLRGDGGQNQIGGGLGDDLIEGRGGDDFLNGDEGNDEIRGGDGADQLNGDEGDDRLYGDAGDDIFWVDVGDDLYDGGAGTDSVVFPILKTGVTVDLSAGRQEIAPGVWATFNSIEVVDGTGSADSVKGDGGANTLRGGGGNDILDGGGGEDVAVYFSNRADFTVAWTVDGWKVTDNRPEVRDGVDLVWNVETLKFADASLRLGDGMIDLVGNLLRVSGGPGGSIASDLSARLANERINLTQALSEVITKADATTSVATMSYQFFTGSIPTKGGVEYLVAPDGGNANNLNSAYYQSFNLENRYINFAVNLGRGGEGKAAFQTNYGSLTLFDATKKAYAEIFGRAPTDAQATTMLSGGRDAYFASYGGDGLTGLGTKAAMVGWLLAEASKADVGVLARSNTAWLTDLADGSAPFAVNILAPSSGYYKADFAFGG